MTQCHQGEINSRVVEDRLDYVWHSIQGLGAYGIVDDHDERREIYVD